MFIDGLWYATLSRNLAEGTGTFWQPHLTETFFSAFYSHPPLLFGLQSILFAVFGDHLFVERIYCLLIALLTIYSIHYFWRYLFRDNSKIQALSFLPILFWLSNETVYFGYVNNLMEGTLGLFTFWAVFLLYRYSEASETNNLKSWGWLLVSGVLILLAILTKGLVGLFPLAFLGIYWLVYRRISFSWMFLLSIFLSGVVTIGFWLILQNPAAHLYLDGYLDIQLSHALSGESKENLRTTRFHILKMLVERSLPVIILVVMLLIYQFQKKKALPPPASWKMALLFILVGLSGTLPIMITLKQVSYYLLPVLPFYSLGFAILVAPFVLGLFDNLQGSQLYQKLSWTILAIFLVYTIGYGISQVGKIDKRDRQLLTDIMLVGKQVPEGSIISHQIKEVGDMTYGYFARYYHISLESSSNRPFLLLEKGDSGLPQLDVLNQYQYIPLGTERFNLYQLKEESVH
ncbi:MAG: hypothetical protein DHS20C18_20690 [Saprospiraceae bacterium]|nr:MAG: hypothetical protein DHS20C18_20690 [Saprospiraceae bacterium]